MKILSILVLFVALTTGCAGWTYNGIEGEELRAQISKQEFVPFVGGIITSFVVHTVSHLIYYEYENFSWRIVGTREVISSDVSDSQKRWAGRVGWLGQLSIGKLLNILWEDSPFVTGYNIGTTVHLVTYPLINTEDGDIAYINEGGGNGNLEHIVYSAISFLPLLDTKESE